MKNSRGYAVCGIARLWKAAVALTAFLCLTTGAKIVAKADGLEVSYFKETTDFEELLEGDAKAKMVFDTFAAVTDEEGERIYTDEFLIGLIANIYHEGESGAVEWAFSKRHQYDFKLPSGGDTIQTAEDLRYCKEWTTSNKGSKKNFALKGSLGVSSLQWSYNRRITWLSILEENIGDRDYITEEDLLKTDALMLLSELTPTSDFYRLVTYYAEKKNGDADDYAEAICDFYVVPAGACFSMSGEGSACEERMAEANKLWEVFVFKDKKTVEVKVSSVVNKQKEF